MHRLTLGLVVAVLVLSAVPLSALNVGGDIVVIPVIGRFPGDQGTQWQTDVFISNPYSPIQTVTLKFHRVDGVLQEETVTLQPFSNVSLPDIVLNTFGLENGRGVLEVVNAPGFTIHARATVYNTGNPAGVFGQSLPGLATRVLSRQAYLFGLSGLGNNRVNIGVANPNDAPVEATVYIGNASNALLHSRAVTIPPHSYVQYDNIFTLFGIVPQANVQVNISTAAPLIYGYASEVRNDTGDAVFMFGTSPNS